MVEQLGVGPAALVHQNQGGDQGVDGRIRPAAFVGIQDRKVRLRNLAEHQLVELILLRVLQLLALLRRQLGQIPEQLGLLMGSIRAKHQSLSVE